MAAFSGASGNDGECVMALLGSFDRPPRLALELQIEL
jgi:hypothetical protein